VGFADQKVLEALKLQSVKGNGNINPKIRVKKIFPSLIGDKAFAKYIFTGTKGGAGIGSFALHLLSFAYYEAGLSITACWKIRGFKNYRNPNHSLKKYRRFGMFRQ
jgi:hypothetical protein